MSDETTDAYYRTRTRNMAVTIILVSVAPLLLVTSLVLYEFRHSYREKVEAHLIELVQKHKQNIDNFLSQRLGDIRILAMTFGFDALSDEAFLKERLSVLQEVYGPVFVDLGIIDSKGVQHTYAGPFSLVRADYSQADWFRKALQRDYFVSDVFLGLRNLPHFIVAVRREWRGEPWILRATVDFVAFNALVEKIRMGQTGFAFILNREGELQTKPYLDIVSNTGVFLNLLKEERKPGDRLRVTERVDASGKKNLYVASPLKDREWVLVYQQNAADAFSDLRHAQRLTLVIILIGGLGIGTTAVVISRRLFTRIAKSDREKEMMNEQIVETGKLASVGELAAGIAHEINNPVAIMVEEAGWIEDLLGEEEFKQGENLDEFRRALKQIKNQGRRCKEITHKLLSFARKTDPTVQEVQINDVVEEMVALSAQRAKFSSVVINTTLDERLPSVSVSQSELQQVLLNLINNALDAMEKKGGRLDLITQMDGEFITIFVADTGPGIPRANLDRIFDPFFTTKPVGKGTGLGLSICYGIIKKMGGDITVRSIVNMGTTFRIQIPLPRQKEEKAAKEAWVQTEGAH
jgi:two-component system NtrC family sensor kinase